MGTRLAGPKSDVGDDVDVDDYRHLLFNQNYYLLIINLTTAENHFVRTGVCMSAFVVNLFVDINLVYYITLLQFFSHPSF